MWCEQDEPAPLPAASPHSHQAHERRNRYFLTVDRGRHITPHRVLDRPRDDGDRCERPGNQLSRRMQRLVERRGD
jgi:hypothetical protein